MTVIFPQALGSAVLQATITDEPLRDGLGLLVDDRLLRVRLLFIITLTSLPVIFSRILFHGYP